MIRVVESGHVCTGERETFEFLCDIRSLSTWSRGVDRIEPIFGEDPDNMQRFIMYWRTGVIRRSAEFTTRFDRLNRTVTLYATRGVARVSASLQVTAERDGSRIKMETKVYLMGPLSLFRGLVEREVVRQNRMVMESLKNVTEELIALREMGLEPTPSNVIRRRKELEEQAPRR